MEPTRERTQTHPDAGELSDSTPSEWVKVKFFFPDSQDQVDPHFDFRTETTAEYRVRQRDDRYAHEVLKKPAYDGLLVSKPIVDGLASAPGKYSMAKRHRRYQLGA